LRLRVGPVAHLVDRRLNSGEPANELAQLALRQVELMRRTSKLPPDTVRKADADRDNVRAQLDAADMELIEGDTAAAFARLIDAVRRSSGSDRDAARGRLLELFAIIGESDPLVGKARRDLASVLF